MNNKYREIQTFLLEQFFNHRTMIKMLHFQTKMYGAHKALDVYLTKFDLQFDSFMEVSQGIFGIVEASKIKISTKMATDETIQSRLESFSEFLRSLTETHGKYTDLLTIRDEMLTNVNTLKYLLNFQ